VSGVCCDLFCLLRHLGVDPCVILLATGVQNPENSLKLLVAEAACELGGYCLCVCRCDSLVTAHLPACLFFVQVWRQAWASLQGGQQGIRRQ
jgi:hypothetical protein